MIMLYKHYLQTINTIATIIKTQANTLTETVMLVTNIMLTNILDLPKHKY